MSLSMVLNCPSMGNHEEAVTTWRDTLRRPLEIDIDMALEGEDAGFLRKCQNAYLKHKDADIIGYLHADLFINEHNWDDKVLAEFENPQVAVVGFVGAAGLAHEDIYKICYNYVQLARNDVWSNLSDWEVHGGREPGSKQVAVVDSCAVFVRREFLSRIGGWPVSRYPNSSHCSDLYICCLAHRYNSIVKMVGIAASHRGGGKGQAGTEWLDAMGSDWAMHQRAHELIYDDFRDVLPVRIRS